MARSSVVTIDEKGLAKEIGTQSAESRSSSISSVHHGPPTTANEPAFTSIHGHVVARQPHHTWQPSVFRIRPLLGIAALGVAVVCLFASLGILLGSNGEPYENWHFAPTVYLAIATAISNTALNCALAQAAPISWWYKASRGSEIRDLELEWEAGQSFPRAMGESYEH